MKNYLLFVDTETTGLNPDKNGMFQVAGYIDLFHHSSSIQNVACFNFTCNIFEADEYQKESFKSHGKTETEVRTGFTPPNQIHKQLKKILEKNINIKEPYYIKGSREINPNRVRYQLIGKNVEFDNDFLKAWFLKNGDKWWWTYCKGYKLSLEPLAYLANHLCGNELKDLKLGTLAKYFNIEHTAHDALSDITASREFYYRFLKCLTTMNTNALFEDLCLLKPEVIKNEIDTLDLI